MTAFSNAFGGQDIARLEIFIDHLHDPLPASRRTATSADVGENRRDSRAVPSPAPRRRRACVLAVPMPAQTPGPRMATSPIALISSIDTLPKASPPAVAKTSSMSQVWPLYWPLG